MEFEAFKEAIEKEAANVSPDNAAKGEQENRFFKKSNKEDLKGRKQDRKERKVYALLIFNLLCFWLMFDGFIFLFKGLGKLSYSDNVLITLLTTTTVNVIGIFYIVDRYLFQPKK